MSKDNQAVTYDDNNVFAKMLAGDIPCHRVYEDDKTLAFMDIMPQAEGHVLVIPKQKAVDLADLEPEYAAAVLMTAKKSCRRSVRYLNVKASFKCSLMARKQGRRCFTTMYT